MNDNEKQFEDFVSNIKFDDTPDLKHRDKLEQNLLCAMAKQPRQIKIWRIIMKSQVTKLATAAVIIVAVVLFVTILDNSTPIVWAIEQSIEAMSQYKAVIVEGLDSERTWREGGSLEQKPFKSWAVANEDQTMVEKYRHEVDGVPVIITNGQKTWRYDPQNNTVRVENHPYIASECWCGSQFLEQLRDGRDRNILTHWDITYGKGPATGEQRAFLKIAWLDERYNGPRSMWIEFDLESRLVVSFKQWENAKWEGPASLIGERITYYEKLPDDLFEFEIPEGATVTKE